MRENDDEGRFCDPTEKDEFRSVCESSWIGEGDGDRNSRLKRPVGVLDVAIIKQTCPGIPDDFLFRMMNGGR